MMGVDSVMGVCGSVMGVCGSVLHGFSDGSVWFSAAWIQ